MFQAVSIKATVFRGLFLFVCPRSLSAPKIAHTGCTSVYNKHSSTCRTNKKVPSLSYPSPLPGLGIPDAPEHDVIPSSSLLAKARQTDFAAELLLTSVLTGNVYSSNGSAPFPCAANKRSGGTRVAMSSLDHPTAPSLASEICTSQ
jgi:hypothetical protein